MSDFVLTGLGFIAGALAVGTGAYVMILRAARRR